MIELKNSRGSQTAPLTTYVQINEKDALARTKARYDKCSSLKRLVLEDSLGNHCKHGNDCSVSLQGAQQLIFVAEAVIEDTTFPDSSAKKLHLWTF